jgi:regulator of protease activity HflC (stomatin/prohibitin superfamily)
MVLSSPSADRPHNSCDTDGDTATAAHLHSISLADSDSQPQQKCPRLSAALVEKRTEHQQEREATEAYFRHLQDELDRQKAERVAKLDARQQLLRAEEEAARQAYAEAVEAGEAWISKCAVAAADRMNTDHTAAATAQLASQLRELVDEYTQASWRTVIESDGQASLPDIIGALDDTTRVSPSGRAQFMLFSDRLR